MPARGDWHAEAVRWAREGVSSDEAADRWGIEPKAARARLLRAAQRARVEYDTRKRRSNAECAATREIVERVLLDGGGTHEVARETGLSTSRASTLVCRARKRLGLSARPGWPAPRRRCPSGYVGPCSSSEPREGGRWVSLDEAREVR